jgi:hypothetical protein
VFNDYLTDTNDKLNSIKHCTMNGLELGFTVEKSFLFERLDTMKLDVLSKASRIKIGKEIVQKSNNTENIVLNIDSLCSQYKSLYMKIDTIQKSLNNDRYTLTSQLIEYLKNV